MTSFADLFKRKPKGPPERQFLENPEGLKKYEFSARNFLEKKWVKWTLMLGFIVFMVFFLSLKSKKTHIPIQMSPVEDRIVMNESAMQRAIGQSVKSKLQGRIEKPVNNTRNQKRKLDSAMAVYVLEKQPERNSQTETKHKKDSVLGLPSGTKIPALLQDRVFSFNVAAPVLAVLAKDFMVRDKVVIPEKSKFLGEASVVKSLDRINVSFNLLVFPDGTERRIHAIALSEDGAAGIKGKVDKQTDKKVLKAIGESVLSVGTLFLGGRSTDPFSLEDQLRINAAQNFADEARRDLREVKVEKSVTAEAYQPVYVLLLDAV